jgi:plasmid maintenance system antidote protein VapI
MARIPDQDWRAIIAERIRSEGYSFKALGVDTDVSPASITRFVKGERGIKLETAEKLCKALGLALVPREMVKGQDGD